MTNQLKAKTEKLDKILVVTEKYSYQAYEQTKKIIKKMASNCQEYDILINYAAQKLGV